MPRFWMINDREYSAVDGFGDELGPLTFWVADTGPLDDPNSWRLVAKDEFQRLLLGEIATFPLLLDPADHEDQKHVTLFIHGYNNNWEDSVGRYENVCKSLFAGAGGMGLCILFSWPSKGSPAEYLADRSAARQSSPDLTDVLADFYDWLVDMEKAAATNPADACRAKTSIIAHSMGNYVLENAMHRAWDRKNRPLLVSLVNQLLMVAADVDNDLFKSGETTHDTDGDAVANLTYRVTALYTGRDPVLGLSAGLKHFGKRRLGRSGLDRTCPLPDNVWDVDCSDLISPGAKNIHSAYFDEPKTVELMRQVLRGVDRNVLATRGLVPPRLP